MSDPVVVGGRVAVLDPNGIGATISAEELPEALARGYTLESGAAHGERLFEEKYGHSPVRAGLEGAARGLTFGLTDVLAGPDEGLIQRRARNPVASTLGEVGGAVGGLALTGLGGLAERAGAAAFGAPGILSRAGAAAVRGGLEGAAIGTGQAVSQLALSDDPLTAESIAGALGHNVGIGALTGGVGGGALSLAGSGLRGAVNLAGKGVRKAAEKLSAELAETTAPAAGFEDLAGLGPKELRAAAKAETENAWKQAGVTAGHEDLAGLGQAELRKATQAEVEAQRAARLGEGEELAKDLFGFDKNARDDMMRLKQTLPKGTGLMKDAIKAQGKLTNVVKDVRTLAEEPGRALGAVRELRQQLEFIESRLPKGMLEGAQATTPEAIEAGAATAKLQGRAASMMERLDDFEARIKSLTAEPTSPRLDAIRARQDALSATIPKTARQEAIEALQAAPPQATPILDTMAKTIGGGIGGAIGHAIPVPYAGVAGAWLGKEIGESSLKPLLKSILGNFVEKTGAIEEGAGKLLGRLAPPPSAMNALSDLATAGGVKGSSFQGATEAVKRAAANPEQTRGAILQELAGVSALNPKLAEKVADTYQLRLQFLADKAPPTLTMGISGQVVPPSSAEEAKFARYVAAANDPMRLLKELRAGTLMPETIEAAEKVYPGWTQRIKDAVSEQLTDPDVAKKLSYPMRLQLGTFLGTQTVEATMNPQFVSRMQATFQTPPEPMPEPKLKTPSAGRTAMNEPPTSAQKLTAK